MKKLLKLISAVGFTLASLVCFSCADAVVNDGTDVRSFVKGSSAGGAAPFYLYNDVMDFQLWYKATEGDWSNGGAIMDINSTKGVTVIAVGTVDGYSQKDKPTWWGFAIVSDGSNPEEVYDMSAVKAISFEAKSDKDSSKIRVGLKGDDDEPMTLTTEWDEYTTTIKKSHSSEEDTLLVIRTAGGEYDASGIKYYVRNVKFLDAGNNEIVPSVKK